MRREMTQFDRLKLYTERDLVKWETSILREFLSALDLAPEAALKHTSHAERQLDPTKYALLDGLSISLVRGSIFVAAMGYLETTASHWCDWLGSKSKSGNAPVRSLDDCIRCLKAVLKEELAKGDALPGLFGKSAQSERNFLKQVRDTFAHSYGVLLGKRKTTLSILLADTSLAGRHPGVEIHAPSSRLRVNKTFVIAFIDRVEESLLALHTILCRFVKDR